MHKSRSECVQNPTLRRATMRRTQRWLSTLLAGLFLITGCTIQQQRDVLGTIGTVIPGSSTSRVPSLYSSSASGSSAPSASPSTPAPSPSSVAAAPPPPPSPPPPTVDLGKTDAKWVLQTMQRAMTADPSAFQACLDDSPCQKALSAHLKQLQKQADGTLDLPAVYDQYDIKREKK